MSTVTGSVDYPEGRGKALLKIDRKIKQNRKMNHHIPPRSLDTLVSKNSEMNRSPLLAQ